MQFPNSLNVFTFVKDKYRFGVGSPKRIRLFAFHACRDLCGHSRLSQDPVNINENLSVVRSPRVSSIY